MNPLRPVALSVVLTLVAASCDGTLDAGTDTHGLLPVDQRNPVIIDNDSTSDNWIGEYTVLLANTGGLPLAGIVVTASSYWANLGDNQKGWAALVTAAQSSGLKNIPFVTPSMGMPLMRPPSGDIDATAANDSAGAELIVKLSAQLSLPWRPVVVLAGTQLTDLADAYLVDHSVVDRVIVVASLGTYTAPNGAMGAPNGELDPWADWIVAQKFRYIQTSAFYDQTGDVPTARLPNLPQNPLGMEMAAKQPNLFSITTASDQVSVLSVALPNFTTMVQRASPDTSAAFDPTHGPSLIPNPNGNVWIVTAINAPLAGSYLWLALLSPATYGS